MVLPLVKPRCVWGKQCRICSSTDQKHYDDVTTTLNFRRIMGIFGILRIQNFRVCFPVRFVLPRDIINILLHSAPCFFAVQF